jgi:6-phosphogluconolactonase
LQPLPVETIVANPAELARVFADRFTSAARRVQTDGRALSLVLPGGSVAQAFLPVVAEASVDWALVDVFWGDERAVRPDHPESNYRLADELLLGRVAIGRARVHRMPADGADLDAGARAYEAELVRVLGDPPRFDVVLLGVGPDGHVCSLFPAHPALQETSRRVVAVTDSPKPPSRRLTLTLAALEGADIYIAAFGAAKAEVVREALTTPTSPLPVARAARAGKRAVFMLDRDAAGTPTTRAANT